MKTSTILRTLLAAFVAAASFTAPTAHAEDIDIYGGTGGSAIPNIVIVFDNASRNNSNFSGTCPYSGVANISTLQDATRCALAVTAQNISQQPGLLGKFRIGIVTYGSGSNQGGQWIIPTITPGAQNVSTPLVLMDQTGVNQFLTAVSTPINTANNASSSGGMQEAWAFLTGDPRAASAVFGSNTTYTSKIGLACQRSFIIFIGAATGNNGEPETGNTGSVGGAAGLANAGATAAQQVQINTSNLGTNTGDDSAWGDEWARFLYQTDFNNNQFDKQNIVTYTIATGGTRPNYVQFLHSMANQGGGKPFVSADINSMVQALLQILNEIAAINSVFASSSLPVSSNAQGTYLNQVFIGMFRPNALDAPRWMGNLKQYQFGVQTAPNGSVSLFLADAKGNSAISSSGTGFISPNAYSFWTPQTLSTGVLPDSIGGFWVSNPQSVGGGYDSPDGEIVEKGAAGQQLRLANLQDNYVTNPTTPRNVYTCTTGCTGGSNLSATPFATTNGSLTAAAFSISNPTYTQSVTNISRVSSTGIVTVQLSATPNPTISDPTTVVISGSTSGQFDGSLATAGASASGTTVTYTLPQELPPTSLTAPASWTVSGAASGSTNITSLTKTGGPGLVTGTATLADLTFGGAAQVAVGDTIVIANSTGYNGTSTVTGVNVGAKTVTFTMSESPSVYGGGGQVSVGSSTCKTNGNASSHNCDTFAASNTNGPGAGQANLPGLVRGTSCSSCIANSGNILMVNFSGGSTNLNAVVPATGVQAYIQSGATPSNYVNTSTGWKIVGVGASCSVTETHTDGTSRTYTGTANGSGPRYYTLCLDLGASFVLAPGSTNGATTTPQTTGTRQGAYTRTLSALSRAASSCTGSGSGATANNATVTVTTTSAHGFAANEVVQISSASPGTNESTYIGSATIATVPTSTTFTYTVATTPACKDTSSGMQITYQSSSGSINVTDFIRWVRGYDNIGDEQSPGNGITIRPSVHGDVLHSRPLVVNYGGTTGVVVFYGANDGTFRAVNGNAPINNNLSIGSTVPGGELWSFIPTEFFSKLTRLYNNSPLIKLSTTPTGIIPTPTQKDYFFDGSTGLYQNGSTVSIFLSARRGGRLIYALNVNDPSTPKLLWNKSSSDNNMAELGYTWSTPKPALLRGYVDSSGNPKPVVVFGAGFDPNEDSEPPLSDTMGRGIFILDAADGSIVWQAGFSSGGGTSCTGTPCLLSGMTYSIPADLTLVNRDFDTNGYIDRIYAADLGGNIWRVDLEPAGYTAAASAIGPSTWKVTQLASLGGTGSTKRKFFYPPDVVATKNFDMVLAATGDREHPMYSASSSSSYAIVNRFYGLKDPNTGASVALGSATITDSTSSTADAVPTGLTNQTTASTSYSVATANDSGFYITLGNAGEKGVNAPVTVGGYTYFGTSTPPTPSSQACNNLGTARGYQVNFLTGAAGNIVFDGGGLPPSPVAGLVNVTVNGTTRSVPFCLGCGDPSGSNGAANTSDGRSSLGGVKPPIPVPPIRKRVYWYIEKHDT